MSVEILMGESEDAPDTPTVNAPSQDPDEFFANTGQRNTAKAVKERIDLMRNILHPV
jgi:hypothetical protein